MEFFSVFIIVACEKKLNRKSATINYGPSAAANTTLTLPGTYLGLVINYTGSTIPPGVYKMYSSITGTEFRPLIGNLPQYYRGGTLT